MEVDLSVKNGNHEVGLVESDGRTISGLISFLFSFLGIRAPELLKPEPNHYQY
jgi:hypothetical protein